jgi:hypothetical protein
MRKYVATATDMLIDRLQAPASHATLIFVAGYTFLWGLWVLLFDVFNQAQLYSVLMDIGPENVFGGAAIISGLCMAAAVLYNEYPFTGYGALIGFVFWGMIATGYFLGDYENTGGITASGVSVYSAFMYLNIRLNQKSQHDLHFE